MKLKKTKQHYEEPATDRSVSKKLIKRQVEEQEAQEEIEDFLLDEASPQRISPMGKKRYE